MDGNFGGTMQIRAARADTIIFFDLPRLVCLWSAVKRVLFQRWQRRAGLAAGCSERLSWEFVSWIWHFPARSRHRILLAIERAGPDVRVIRITSRSQLRSL